MKKYLWIVLLIFGACFLTFSSEKTDMDNEYAEIKKEPGIGFFKGNQLLHTRQDLMEAISPVPEAKNLYEKAIGWQNAAITSLVLGITTNLTMIILPYIPFMFMFLFYRSYIGAILYPVLTVTLITEIIFIIVGFVLYSRLKRKAIATYNSRVREFNEKKVLFNHPPRDSKNSENELIDAWTVTVRL